MHMFSWLKTIIPAQNGTLVKVTKALPSFGFLA